MLAPILDFYVDGAALPSNPGYGGAGVVTEYKNQVLGRALFLGPMVTNQQAELVAVFLALRFSKQFNVTSFRVHTDSKYAISMIQKNWKARKNKALVYSLRRQWEELQRPEIIWVKGHSGISGQELSDRLANYAALKQESFTEVRQGDIASCLRYLDSN